MFTYAVISCNRAHYLRNCIESVLEFAGDDLRCGEAEVLVIDNGSVETGITEYLCSLPESISLHRFADRTPNELYRAMNHAVEFSRERNRPYIHFIQDDCQFLRRDEELLTRIRRAFEACPDVYQLHVSLAWKMKLWKWENQGQTKVVEVPSGDARPPWKWLHLCDRPPCDTGFTRIDLFDRIGLFPDHVTLKGPFMGEQWLYEQCRRIGAARMYSLDPVMGMLPDAAYVRGDQRIGRYFAPPSRFYLEPLTDHDIRSIRENEAMGKMSCIEDNQRPDGWMPRSSRIRSEEGSCHVATSCAPIPRSSAANRPSEDARVIDPPALCHRSGTSRSSSFHFRHEQSAEPVTRRPGKAA